MNFKKFENKYIFTGNLEVINALHIGSGIVEGDADSPFVKTSKGKHYIPGSSFRGYLRSKLEGIIEHNLKINQDEILDIIHIMAIFGFTNLDKEFKKEPEKIEKMYKLLNLENKKDKNKVSSFMGKIHISDMPIQTVEKEIMRDGIAIDRNTGVTKKGAKFDYNVIGAGNKFKFEMSLENVKDYEIELIGIALKMIERGDLFGGKLSRGIGKVQLNLDDKCEFIKSDNKEDFSKYLFDGIMQKKNTKDMFNQEKISL